MEMAFSAFAQQTPAMPTSYRCANDLADLPGESPNHIDDLFKDLEDWKAILSSLPDYGVDQNQDDMELTASAIDFRLMSKYWLGARTA